MKGLSGLVLNYWRMRTVLLVFFLLGSAGFAGAETNAPAVLQLQLPEGSNSGEIQGRLEEGQTIALDWAARSSVAAFPATRFEMFSGNHVLYRFPMPAACKLKITLTPSDGEPINLYALRQGVGETAAPPNVTSAISGEASYPIYAHTGPGSVVRSSDGGVRTIEFVSIDEPYSILVGVAGAEGLAEGSYALRFDLEFR